MTPDPSNRSNGRPPTLREIADQAGVHISTASRVLRQPEPADGWSDSALRVRQVAEELGYQPNLWAASLRTRKTTTIGVVMPRLTDVVVATMFQGIEEAATAAGYSVLLSSPPDDLDAQRKAVEFLVSVRVRSSRGCRCGGDIARWRFTPRRRLHGERHHRDRRTRCGP
jgi:LacI family transcriptional regulator